MKKRQLATSRAALAVPLNSDADPRYLQEASPSIVSRRVQALANERSDVTR